MDSKQWPDPAWRQQEIIRDNCQKIGLRLSKHFVRGASKISIPGSEHLLFDARICDRFEEFSGAVGRYIVPDAQRKVVGISQQRSQRLPGVCQSIAGDEENLECHFEE